MGREDYRKSGIADVPYLRNILESLRGNPKGFDRELFFSLVLLGYYDAMWEGMRSEVGDIIFRISDLIDEGERRMILVYPNPDGSIDTEYGKWDSLEDWRQSWLRQKREIASLTELWPGARNYFPLFNPSK